MNELIIIYSNNLKGILKQVANEAFEAGFKEGSAGWNRDKTWKRQCIKAIVERYHRET